MPMYVESLDKDYLVNLDFADIKLNRDKNQVVAITYSGNEIVLYDAMTLDEAELYYTRLKNKFKQTYIIMEGF